MVADQQASHRVNRGGGWNNNPSHCRSANRDRNSPDNRNNNLGFRVARSSLRLGGRNRSASCPTGVVRGRNRGVAFPVLVAPTAVGLTNALGKFDHTVFVCSNGRENFCKVFAVRTFSG
ncbi:MAG: formylglycine-generating enzyme family protein [Planctomycetaceae bacterium]